MTRFAGGWSRIQHRRRLRADGVYVAPGSFIHPQTRIGRGTRVNVASHLDHCEIGAFCAIGGRLVIRSRNHLTQFLNMQEWTQRHVIASTTSVVDGERGPVRVGNAVWIGDFGDPAAWSHYRRRGNNRRGCRSDPVSARRRHRCR